MARPGRYRLLEKRVWDTDWQWWSPVGGEWGDTVPVHTMQNILSLYVCYFLCNITKIKTKIDVLVNPLLSLWCYSLLEMHAQISYCQCQLHVRCKIHVIQDYKETFMFFIVHSRTQYVTVPLKSKLPPSHETRNTSLETCFDLLCNHHFLSVRWIYQSSLSSG